MAFTTILPETARLGKETLDVNGAVKIPADATSVWIRLLLDKAIVAASDFQVTVNTFASDDGKTWEEICGFGCEGQKYRAAPVESPSMRFRGESLKRILGRLLRVELDVKNSKAIGVEVEVV